ncbi:MAG: TRAP transporter substrate-binding protein DctP, partial [bacterium]
MLHSSIGSVGSCNSPNHEPLTQPVKVAYSRCSGKIDASIRGGLVSWWGYRGCNNTVRYGCITATVAVLGGTIISLFTPRKVSSLYPGAAPATDSLNSLRLRFPTIFMLLLFSLSVLIQGCSPGKDAEETDVSTKTITVRMGTLFSTNHHLSKKLDWIAQELEKRSGDRFSCQVFSGGSAGGEKENLEDLLLGNLELMDGAGSYFYQYCPELAVIELPLYRWKDREEAWRVIRGYWDRFQESAQAKGFYLAGLDIRDYWGILYKEPISSLEEIKNA